MNIKPIIFNADMVRALLDGRKTQTRRPVKGVRNDNRIKVGKHLVSHVMDAAKWCPFGQAGDLLYVREACLEGVIGSYSLAQYAADESYVTQGSEQWAINAYWWYSKPVCPSIHMPRWASRLTLRITDVRVERVQDITKENALAEGLKKWPHKNDFAYGYDGGAIDGHGTPTGAFHALWNSIYNNWRDNPWVWVVEFEVIHKNVDEVSHE